MSERAVAIAETLVALTDPDVAGPEQVLAALAGGCEKVFGATAARMVLTDQHGRVQVVVSSTDDTGGLESSEVRAGEGLCFDALRTGERVGPVGLNQDAQRRWSRFVRDAAGAAGYRWVAAFPMRRSGETIGAVCVLLAHQRPVPSADLRVVQAMVDAATVSIVHQRSMRRAAEAVNQLQGALDSRVAIEQAKGMLAERTRLDLEEAFELLRRYARDHNETVSAVAAAVVRGELSSDQLVAWRGGSDSASHRSPGASATRQHEEPEDPTRPSRHL
jgi:GAF domain-containing protein